MIEITTTRHEYTGDGSNVNFPYDFPISHKSELKVWVADVLKTEGTHYTVSGVGDEDGGTVVMVTAPANDASVVIERETPRTQLRELPSEGPLLTEELEAAYDKLTKIVQELQTVFGTAVAGKSIKWDARARRLTTQDVGVYETFINEAVTAGAEEKDLVFDVAAANANYVPFVQPNWNTTWWIPDANKTTTGFRIRFGTPPVGASAKINVVVFS